MNYGTNIQMYSPLEVAVSSAVL